HILKHTHRRARIPGAARTPPTSSIGRSAFADHVRATLERRHSRTPQPNHPFGASPISDAKFIVEDSRLCSAKHWLRSTAPAWKTYLHMTNWY
ncbi:hypothetical protein S245_068200, partial [Arachis hypogaea]